MVEPLTSDHLSHINNASDALDTYIKDIKHRIENVVQQLRPLSDIPDITNTRLKDLNCRLETLGSASSSAIASIRMQSLIQKEEDPPGHYRDV